MPRNGSGNYVLPEAAFSPGTPIVAADVNSDLSDLADAMTDSLARDGQGGMTAVLPLANVGFSYFNDPNTGMRRTAADTQAISCGGFDIAAFTTAGMSVTGALAVSGAFTVGGAPLLPVGLMLVWLGSTAPSKWLLCYGQAISRTTYADLYAVVGTTYGTGDGSTTFNLPDLRGRLPAGKDDMGGSAANRLTSTYFGTSATVLGATGGLESHTLTTAQLAVHSHGVTDPGHTHTLSNATNLLDNAVGNNFQGSSFLGNPRNPAVNSATTGISINNAGSGNAHNNVQPTLITNYIVYAGV